MNVIAKAAALSAAWSRVTGANPPTRIAVTYPLAQADFETMDGDAWGGDKGPHDWGATDYRAANATELVDITAGTLKTGYWLHTDGTYSADRRPGDVAQLHTDSHPGGATYAMWFAAFDDDTGGAAYYLKIVLRMVGTLLADAEATVEEFVDDLYLHGYFEGVHPTQAEAAAGMARARSVGHRALPWQPAEVENVKDYVGGVSRCLASQAPALAGWTVPGGATGDVVAGDDGVTSDAQESGPGGPGWENNDGNAPNTIPVPTSAMADTQPPPPPGPDETIKPT
jgi:hypothetical protein